MTLRQTLKTAARHGWLDPLPDRSAPHTSVEMIEKYYAAHIKNRIDAVDQRHATAQVQTENRKPSAYEIANSTNDLGYNIRNLGW